MKSFENLNKTDVAFSKVENLQTPVRTLLEATSWIDWLFYTAKSFAMQDTVNPKMAGISVYGTKPLSLRGQRWEFRIRNNAQKMKENYVKMILSNLAYITPIRLSFCISTGEREGERERIFVKKKKKKIQNRSETILVK